jgi:hypothetical protein
MADFNDYEKSLLSALQQEDSPTPGDAARVKERVLMVAGVTAVGVTTTAGAAASAGAGVGAGAAAGASAAGATSAVPAGGFLAAKIAGLGFIKTALVAGATTIAAGGAYIATSDRATSDLAASDLAASESAASANGHDGAAVGSPVEDDVALAHSASERAANEALEVSSSAHESAPEQGPAAPGDPTAARRNKRDTAGSSEPTLGARPQASPSVSAPDLAEEAALMGRAQSALQTGSTGAALRALRQHREKFPRGVLAGEREAAFAVAYCKGGQISLGQKRARAFIQQAPKSPMVQRLRAACQLGD